MEWSYFDPAFESETVLDDLNSPWGGHRYFAYDLTAFARPGKLVELGTHRGTSFFAFCQAVKDHGLSCDLFAVDSWKGDPHALIYGEEVFESVREIVGRFYPGLQIHLLRMGFDEAAGRFEDHSIDVLHIDGYHTYDAVRHDFNTWIGKVSENGMILLHDIHVTRDDFGVYKFWDELKEQYPTLEFSHSNGLGVVFKGIPAIPDFLHCRKAWHAYYALMHSTKTMDSPLKEKIIALQEELNVKNRMILERDNSLTWRITRPVRILLDCLFKRDRNNRESGTTGSK
jgi:hypothetical protein